MPGDQYLEELEAVKDERIHCGTCLVNTMRVIDKLEDGWLCKCDQCGKEITRPFCELCGAKVWTRIIRYKYRCPECMPKGARPMEEFL